MPPMPLSRRKTMLGTDAHDHRWSRCIEGARNRGTLVGVGAILAEPKHISPMLANLRRFGPIWPQLGRIRPNLASIFASWVDSGHIWGGYGPKVGRRGANSCSILGRFDGHRQCLARFDQSSGRFEKLWAEIDPAKAKFGKCWSEYTKFGTSGRIRPTLG